MKICILAPRFPFQEAAGDVLRINHIAKYLKSKNHVVALVSFYNKQSNLYDEGKAIYDSIYTVKQSRINSLFRAFISFITGKPLQYGYYCSNRFLKVFRSVIIKEKPDLYISHTHRMVWYLEKNCLKGKSIIEMSDALSKTYSLINNGSHSSWKKYAYYLEKKRISKYEQDLIKNYKKIVIVSEADKKYLGCSKSIYVYPNGRDVLHRESFDHYNKNKIVFVGNMRALQNQDAVLFFVEKIFPTLLEKNSNLEFYIIGAEPPQTILKLENNKNIHVTGYVDDVYEYIKDACFSILPIRIAAGIQNKVLEAMSFHIPVIISALISEGIPEAISGCNCFIANSADEYVEYCTILYENSMIRNKMANEGFKMVDKHYNWQSKLDGYEVLTDD